MEKAKVLSWLKDVLEAPSTKIFHNAIYDVCWLRAMGFKINGEHGLYDAGCSSHG